MDIKLHDHSAQRDYWLCQLAGWGGMTAIALLSSSQSNFKAAMQFALAKTFCIATGFGLSHLWRWRMKRGGWFSAPELPFGRLLTGLAVLAAAQTGFLLLADHWFRNGALLRDPETSWADYALLLVMWFLIFAGWTLCYAVALSRRRARQAELARLELEVSAKEAELRALQFQVNPHFFFNSLNSIRSLVHEDAQAAATALGQLASMMRQRLQAGQSGTITLAEELAAVSAYLGIEKLRFEERLVVAIEVDQEVASTQLPPMVLQTLVENAVKHGVERMVAPCQVRISARRDGGGLVRVEVRNQGHLAADSSSTRLGLANAVRRLALQCGPRAGCVLTEQDGWVLATVTLPQEVA